jgi:formylglycine-generating enzyme required for sulfatase activity
MNHKPIFLLQAMMLLAVWLLPAWAGAADPETRIAAVDGMPQILIPAGAFTMGAADDDAFGRTAETPPHRVELDAYWIDRHEVTNAQYAQFLNRHAKGNRAKIYSYCDLGNPVCRIAWDAASGECVVTPGFTEHPVCAVTWSGADAYARAVKRRLPTEAEWERAARGPQGWRYPWGNEWAPRRTNTRESGPGQPVPVGSIAGDRSAEGVWDLAGNVSEWVFDPWDEAMYQSSPTRNPVAAGSRYRSLVRGGAWCLTEWDCRATSRRSQIDSAARRYSGFRCAETAK